MASVFIPAGIFKREFGKALPPEAHEVFRRTMRMELAVEIKAPGVPRDTRLFKAYATSSRGHRRLVYLLWVPSGDLLLLFYRDKSDKVGANISPTNPAFLAAFDKHLAIALTDLANGDIEKIDVG